MGLGKFFKKSEEKPTGTDDHLAPKQSTSSLRSIRSAASKFESFMEEGQKPRELFRDKNGRGITDPNVVIPSLSTQGSTINPMHSNSKFA